ncbi:hypothetical protein [Phormidium nigroviride]
MLISIHNSVVDNGDENTWDDDTVLALENLATARREGKHSVIASGDTLKKIAQCSRLSQIAQKIYTKLYNHQYTQNNITSYRSAVTRYIEIVNPCLEPEVFPYLGKQIIKVPPRFFNDSELVQKTILLCENSDDAVFYETIAKVYLIWKKINAKILCDPITGGGNTISKEYINIQKEKKRFCLCIVDSDKIAPDGKLGSTASRLQEQRDLNCKNTQTFILDCREIENLIPNSILSELCSGNQGRTQALKHLKLISSSVVGIRDFLDIKKGTRMNEIINEREPKVKEFWQSNFSLNPNISKCIDNWCQTHWQCSNKSKGSHKTKEDCECKISLGFGENTLSDTIKFIKNNNPHELAKLVDESNRSDWEKIGQVILDWCIAESPIRA